MKPRKTPSVYVLLVGVMGLSIVGGVLVFQIFSASIKTQLTKEQQEAIKPIDGTIKEEVINNLEKRLPVTAREIDEVGFVPQVITPSPSAVTATESGQGNQ